MDITEGANSGVAHDVEDAVYKPQYSDISDNEFEADMEVLKRAKR